MKYNPKKIEPRWQKKWLEEKIYEPDLEKAERPFYNLMMFPYPSAEGLHVGNMYAFTGSDIYGRFKRMQGYDVFEPIGLDGFGIHAENYALKIKKNPAEQAKISEKNFYRQLRALGNGFAWDEKLETYDPDYYKWTQWIFTEMFRRGLAYRKKQAVNWCPSCKTVLADEQVVQKQIANSKGQIAKTGVCERCETPVVKRELEQWFFRITDYAERLLKDLGGLDWSEKVKVAQRNWIGKSEGALIKFEVRCQKLDVRSGMHIEVFTTRPDTLFGAAYVVLAPENPLITALELEIKNFPEVIRYIKKARAKKGDERLALGKVKTGVELKGIKAINPASKEEIPIWVADYVLGNVGTGAIMAVPAHDERDFEFAKRHALPIRQVIAPKFSEPGNPPRPGKRTIRRRTVHSIVRRVKDNKILMLQWKGKMWGKNPPRTFIIGGIEEGEDVVKSARREIYEETGYKNLRFVRRLDLEVHTEYFAAHKDENRYAEINVLYFELGSDEHDKVSPEELQKHEPIWIDEGKVGSFVNVVDGPFIWNWFKSGGGAYAGNGVLINSEKFSGQDSENATLEITKFVKGERKVQYRLRDWLISRQRYWGPPIPMIFCEACFAAKKGERKEMPGWYAVPEKGLPVALPKIKDFRPKGKGVSPLATEKSFYEVKCPSCGGKARRETDVSDTFLDSAWYYIAYLAQIANRPPALLRNAKRAGKSQIANPFSNPRIRKWLPIDMYIGGAEHSVLHLLYFRFLAKVFYDWKLVEFSEPAKKFRAHGLLIRGGKKISKSKGNIVNPDEFIEKFGADALRMHLMFLGPFEEGGDFRDSGILGPVRFLERVWRLVHNANATNRKTNATNGNLGRILHRTIKKVTEDIENLRYNTAISALMILLSEFEKNYTLHPTPYSLFLKLLAPFAPHLTEELWRNALGNKTSIHTEPWPAYDPKLLKEETFTLVIQINGKVRDTMEVDAGIGEEEAKKAALGREKISSILHGETPTKIIYVPRRVLNIVM